MNNFISLDKMAAISASKIKIVTRLMNTVDESDDDAYFSMSINKLSKMPSDIIELIIYNYANILPSKYVLRDWVDINNLDWNVLSSNPCAIELLREKIENEKSLTKEEYEKLDEDKKVNWFKLSKNYEAVDILKKYPGDIVWCCLCDNNNPRAISMIKERIGYENMASLQNTNEYDEEYRFYRICFYRLCYNEHPEIIEMLRVKIELEKNIEYYNSLDRNNKIDWGALSSNPKAIELLAENLDKVDWCILSENPEAIDILTANPDKIFWLPLSSNPKAYELLRDRVEYEKTLTEEEYYSLEYNMRLSWKYLSENIGVIEILKANPEKICWKYLAVNKNAIELIKKNILRICPSGMSENPSAIEILKENETMIVWRYLSNNANAIELLKERAEYESTLTPEEYNNLGSNNRIDWEELSKRRDIFKIV